MSVIHADADAGFTALPLAVLIRKTGWSRPRLQTLAVVGRIRTLVSPGEKPRYCLEDALAIKQADAR